MTFSPHSLQNFIVRLVQSENVQRFLLQPIQFRGWSAPAQLVIRGVDPILNNQPAEKAGPIGHQIRTKLQGEEFDATRLPLFSARSSRTTNRPAEVSLSIMLCLNDFALSSVAPLIRSGLP